MSVNWHARTLGLFAAIFLVVFDASAATHKRKKTQTGTSTRRTVAGKTTAQKSTKARKTVRRTVSTKTAATTTTTHGVIHSRVRYSRHRRPLYSPWSEPTFADSTIGDNAQGEDPAVRKAAVEALGPYNGTVVVADPQTGRILSIVNQKLALTGAFQPCSTIKVVVSLASLSEGIINPATPVHLARRFSMNMTDALAKSNNAYFARLGEELGFERVSHYAQMFGLGEKAGLDIDGEAPGTVVDSTPSDGIGMMTSFGSGIRLTPLELTSIISTVANGGTMYYLQYPRTNEEIQAFQPKVKRYLNIANSIPEVRPGMMGAVEYGTARRASLNQSDPLFGKTGTCTDTTKPGVHLGWFGSFSEVGRNKLAVVVLLTGGRGVSGPVASGIAGQVYRKLNEQQYFTPDRNPIAATPVSLTLQN